MPGQIAPNLGFSAPFLSTRIPRHAIVASGRTPKSCLFSMERRLLAGVFVVKGLLSRIADWPERTRAAHYSVKELAQNCGVSRSQLRRFIITKEGKQLHQWLNGLRMEAALGMLKRGDSVKAAAYSLGYSKPANFSRDFKRFYRIHPSQARGAKDFPPRSK
jgi:AraC-like DNA-binding protein